MYWSLFVITALVGSLDNQNEYVHLDTFNSRIECEYAKARIYRFMIVPKEVIIECVKTDEA